ncbi:MAG: acyl-CoA dehydrogenase family protein [Hyphomonadaceae bacterium]|nr:acyl-CoA dehydrogenase family protein [Hyphomonadaceae bacterium]
MEDLLDLSELRDAVRGALKDRELTIPGEEGRPMDRALWRDMAALGWLGLGVDGAYGGLGQSFAHLALLHEELGRIVASTPTLTTFAAAGMISAHGDESTKAEILPAIAAGELSVGLTLSNNAVRADGGRLSGVLEDVLFGADVDLIGIGADGCVAFIRRDQAGVSVQETPIVDLTRKMVRLKLDGVEPISKIDVTQSQLATVQDEIAVAVACDAIGGAQAILERTIEYLGMRMQFGRPIGSFQALKHRVAHWKVQLEAAAVLIRHAASAIGAEEGASALSSGAKFYACDLYAAVAEDAIQLHGGIGFTWEHPCHLFLKRAKLNQQLFGDSIAHKERTARLAFGGSINSGHR